MKKTAILTLAALGVVYGDIGTSPLYAINQIFFGSGRVELNRLDILGSISLVFWAITIIISFKYVFYVLRADNEGEGGVFALYSLLTQSKLKKLPIVIAVCTLLIFAAGLLFGDGIITPAISVISAVEGLKVIAPTLSTFIVPLTIVILTLLFAIQRRGTASVGKIFGPIVMVWFFVISILGLTQILHYPYILEAINPIYVLQFITQSHLKAIFWVLGAVMLTVTGGEAMYADMGHFGRKPIRFSWFSVVYPALLLNYFGQGAFLLSNQKIINENIFFSMVPHWGLIPMVILATFATVIASQALISGAFSLASQAVTLGLFPRLKIIHTHHSHEGQLYVPFINWSLYVGCVALVLIFQSSEKLASAYGLAVSGVMLITTLSMIAITRSYWKWSIPKVILILAPLVLVDLTFFSANTLKLLEGGFIPLGIAIAIWFVMKTWAWGKAKSYHTFHSLPAVSVFELIKLKEKSTSTFPRTMILMSADPVLDTHDAIPALKEVFLGRYGLLPRHLLLLHVSIEKVPHIHGDRHEIITFYSDTKKGSIRSITLHFGFMEELRVEDAILDLVKDKKLHLSINSNNWLIHIVNKRLILSKKLFGIRRLQSLIFRFMIRNSDRTDHFFGLGNKVALSIEVLPVKLT